MPGGVRVLFVALAFGMLIAVVGAVLNWWGFSSDPTGGFSVTVVNNSNRIVWAEQCASGGDLCKIMPYSEISMLKPGQSMLSVQVPYGGPYPVQISSPPGEVLGCLPFNFSYTPRVELVVNVSKMVACGNSLGAASSGGHDWPYIK
jgi:hypothetical protein